MSTDQWNPDGSQSARAVQHAAAEARQSGTVEQLARHHRAAVLD